MKKALIVSLVTTVVVITVLGLVFDDTVESSFKNYEEMAASGIFEAGWLPPYLPRSSFNIREEHDIDTNGVTAIFSYDPEDVLSVRTSCKVQVELENVMVFNCEYRGNEVVIKLFRNGSAEYRSVPKGHI